LGSGVAQKIMIKKLAINASSGAISQIVTAFVGFFLLPYAMKRLGTQEYGIYQLGRSALVLFMFLQFGMGPTLVRFCSQSIAAKNEKEISKIACTASLILFILGIVAFLIGVALIPIFIRFYNIQGDLITETTGMLFFMAASILCNFLLLVPQGILIGANRIDVVNGINIGSRLLMLSLVIVFFEFFAPSLLLYGFAFFAVFVCQLVTLFLSSIKIVGHSVIFRPRFVDKKIAKKITGFGALNLTNSISAAVAWRSPVLIAGKVIGEEAAAYFAPALLIAQTMQGFVAQIVTPLIPYASKDKAENNGKSFSSWAVKIGLITAIVGFGLTLPFSLFGRQIMGLWLGADFEWIWKTVAIMVAGTAIAIVQAVNYVLALGGGDIRPTVKSQAVMAVTVSIGTCIGTILYGWEVFDVAAFFVFCMLIRNIFYLAYAYSGQFGYKYASYLYQVYLFPAIVALGTGFIGYLIKRVFPPETILITGCELLAVAVLYLCAGWFILLPKELKAMLREKIGKKLWEM
jgi:O-antigen/teichoic acid export membrane protein